MTPLYEIDGACERLRCHRHTIYRLADDDAVTLLKIRGKTLVAGVESLIERQLEAARQAKLQQARLAKGGGAEALITHHLAD